MTFFLGKSVYFPLSLEKDMPIGIYKIVYTKTKPSFWGKRTAYINGKMTKKSRINLNLPYVRLLFNPGRTAMLNVP